MENDPLQPATAIIMSFSRINSLIQASPNINQLLKDETAELLAAFINPEQEYGRDLLSGVRFLQNILEGSGWKMSEFLRVLQAHEYLLTAIDAAKEA